MNFNKHLILSLVVVISLGLSQGAFADDNITEGDTKVEVVDTGDGYIKFQEDGVEKIRITGGKIAIGRTTAYRELDIIGRMRCSGGLTADSIYLIGSVIEGDNDKYLEFKGRTDEAGEGAAVKCGGGNTTGHILLIPKPDSLSGPLGNIGINTETPTEMLTVVGNGSFTGTVTTGSSRSLKKDIESLSEKEAISALQKLKPVKFFYKADDKDQNLGFIAEDVPELVARNDRKSLSAMDLVTLSIKVIQEQQEMIENLQKENKEIKKSIGDLSNNKI